MSQIRLRLCLAVLVFACLIVATAASSAPAHTVVAVPAFQEEQCLPGHQYRSISAYDPCSFPEYFDVDWSPPSRLPEPEQLDHPDLNAAYIEQRPRYDYLAAKNKHAPGDTVTFVAHVANHGVQPTGVFDYVWRIDGAQVVHGSYLGLNPGETVELEYAWTWPADPPGVTHTVTFALDPAGTVIEVSELNNEVSDQTNALAVGFWVEQSVYDWFNTHQVNLGLGSVSWDDWAQRQLATWNQMFVGALSSLTPDGVLERVRLDRVTILPDGAWPDCFNTYWPEDRTVDLVWGFVSELVGVSSGHDCGELNFYTNNPHFQMIEMPLLHEMSHARYLIDLYGLNVYTNRVDLSTAVDASAPTLPVDRDVVQEANFPLPAYLALEGELIVCDGKDDAAFTLCTRGAEGTTARSHPAGARVTLATVRLQDGQGNLVQGSAAMPVIGDWKDHLYFNRHPADLMSDGDIYEQHSAYAWNRILGQRPVCGNFNAPCNIGAYLHDIPASNVLEVRGVGGFPVAGAQVEVYRGRSLFPVWYGRHFAGPPDMTLVTDAAGQADMGTDPFGPIIHTYGHSTAVLLLKIDAGDQTFYRFFEITEPNEAYWSGYHDRGVYPVSIGLLPGDERNFLPIVNNRYDPDRPLLQVHFEGTFTGEDGDPGTAAGPTFVPGYSGQGALFDNDDTLTYQTSGNIYLHEGSITFWLKPLWDGNDEESYVFFEVGNSWFNRMRIMKDGANNFRFMIWSDDTEYGIHHYVADWPAGQWHHIRVAWRETTMSLFLDGVLVDQRNDMVLPTALASKLYVGSSFWTDMQAQAVIDEFVIGPTADH